MKVGDVIKCKFNDRNNLNDTTKDIMVEVEICSIESIEDGKFIGDWESEVVIAQRLKWMYIYYPPFI